MKMLSAACACMLAGSVQAQTASPAIPKHQATGVPEAPSLTTSATTMAPVAPGSTQMREVPTPVTAKRSVSSTTGGQVGGGGN